MDNWTFIGLLMVNVMCIDALQEAGSLLCVKQPQVSVCRPKLRRYDISDLGLQNHFYGWTDVQGQGAANDFCRIVGKPPNIWLACALAGTHGESDTNYESTKAGFAVGYPHTWYMKDEDGDGRDDYCRCLGDDQKGYEIICTKAGRYGFYGSSTQGGKSNTFSVTGSINCKNRVVRPEFGRVYMSPN